MFIYLFKNLNICVVVFQKKGTRSKLLTEDGNEIDTMFVDRRSQTDHFPNGNTLVSSYIIFLFCLYCTSLFKTISI